MKESETFAFGKNWERLLARYSDEKLEVAKKSIQDFLGIENLNNKLFIDVGSGSGIFSLAAYDLGARVLSFDVDEDAVQCTRKIREKRGNPERWEIKSGSVLDRDFLSTLPKGDIVYSYGVLHHTGKMWEALENVKPLVKDDGYLLIAIYNKMYGFWNGTRSWQIKKQAYGRMPVFVQRFLEGLYAFRHNLLPYLIRGRDPRPYWRKFHEKRGESLWVDLRDWLGGYPYEAARPDEILNLYKKDFVLENLLTKNTLALNAFLFKKRPEYNN